MTASPTAPTTQTRSTVAAAAAAAAARDAAMTVRHHSDSTWYCGDSGDCM